MDVLLVGTIHFADTPDLFKVDGSSLNHFTAAHFDELTTTLAAFQADQIFVEYPITHAEQLQTLYEAEEVSAEFQRNEIYQIAFRLARKLGHTRVYAADWQPTTDTLGLHVLQDGPSSEAFGRIMSRVPMMMEKLNTVLAKRDLHALFTHINAEETIQQDHALYVDLLTLDDERAFDWVANYWYYRSLRIVRQVKQAITPSTKRILILYGGAHSYLLRQQLQDDPRYNVQTYTQWTKQ